MCSRLALLCLLIVEEVSDFLRQFQQLLKVLLAVRLLRKSRQLRRESVGHSPASQWISEGRDEESSCSWSAIKWHACAWSSHFRVIELRNEGCESVGVISSLLFKGSSTRGAKTEF